MPPYTISNRMLELVSSISEKVGRVTSHKDLEAKPHLRRNNRIRSIHSSLKIEANSLSMDEVRDVINGHIVMGNRNEIQEVKNAYAAYEEIGKLDPWSMEELKRIHGIMTYLLVKESGDFRQGEEGVFSDGQCIFVAPPPNMVPALMEQLFTWMNASKGTIHPLIMAAVFHYEFVFIHPFADGNGRMARLWHTALLYRWRSIFEYIPLESQIEKHQQEYYAAISQCHIKGTSNIFIEFMLEMINGIMDEVMDQISKSKTNTSEYVKRMLTVMEYDVPYTASSVMEQLGLRSRDNLRKNYINPAIELGLVKMTIPQKPNSKNQRYVKI